MSASGENKPCLIGKNTNSQLSEEQDQVHLRLRRGRGRRQRRGKRTNRFINYECYATSLQRSYEKKTIVRSVRQPTMKTDQSDF